MYCIPYFQFLLIIALAFSQCSAKGIFRSQFPEPIPFQHENGKDPGEPLFLTPLIEAGKFDEAKNLSRVGLLPNSPDIVSYSGFLTVNKQYNSNLFFWFFPALYQERNWPVLLWLQGGPGGSSLFGLFNEHGPLVITQDLQAYLRKYTWGTTASLLYIDNPVGTGFSFTDDDAGYARNQTDVANDLYEALQQFFAVFNEYRQNDFYVTGESYAGKYVPAIAYKIHSEGLDKAKINLKGIAIGDGFSDPETMFDYADYLYQIGLVDEPQAQYIREQQELAVKYIQQEEWMKAFEIFDYLLNGDETGGQSYFRNVTGLNYYYNFLYTSSPKEFQYYNQYLALSAVRKAIHVGNLTYNDGSEVEKNLLEDMMKSVKPWVGPLMDNYKVLIYSGQLDIIVAFPLTESFLGTVEWKGASQYKNATRTVWKVNPFDAEVAGYIRQVGDFYQVLVRNAGHILPYDQPRAAFAMISTFIHGKKFN